MNREIKFRGKRIDNGEWVYGDLVHDAFDGSSRTMEVGIRAKWNGRYCNPAEVIQESVGQFIGLKDKKGIEIYEDDIILYQGAKGRVYYCEYNCMYMSSFKLNCSSWSFDSMDEEIEVIGNIHENPELL